MYRVKRVILGLALVTVAAAQSSEPPLSDTRLSTATLVREDLFAGFLADDLPRLARGERSVQLLLEKRPAEKPGLLAWQGSIALYRAVRAHEDKRGDEFQRHYRSALDFFSQSRQLAPSNSGVAAITGGSYVLFADRLPQESRAAAWSEAYDAFQLLWKQQGSFVERLPLHIRGELLSGLAMSAQRTGRAEETAQYLEKMLALLQGTPYEPTARQWKENPATAASTNLTCRSCHDPGRLAARIAALNKQ